MLKSKTPWELLLPFDNNPSEILLSPTPLDNIHLEVIEQTNNHTRHTLLSVWNTISWHLLRHQKPNHTFIYTFISNNKKNETDMACMKYFSKHIHTLHVTTHAHIIISFDHLTASMHALFSFSSYKIISKTGLNSWIKIDQSQHGMRVKKYVGRIG